MATQNPTLLPGYRAAGDLSANQYRFMKMTANPFEATVCAAVTDKTIGVLQNNPKTAGEDCAIANGGTTKVVAAAAIALGASVAPAADGRAQTAVTTQYPAGKALQAAGAAGEIIEIEMSLTLVPLP